MDLAGLIEERERELRHLLSMVFAIATAAPKRAQARQHCILVVLVRLDLGSSPHRNPDDEEIPAPHLHIYREGYGDKWAVLAPTIVFSRTSDLWGSLVDFMTFCRITETPFIERDLFV